MHFLLNVYIQIIFSFCLFSIRPIHINVNRKIHVLRCNFSISFLKTFSIFVCCWCCFCCCCIIPWFGWCKLFILHIYNHFNFNRIPSFFLYLFSLTIRVLRATNTSYSSSIQCHFGLKPYTFCTVSHSEKKYLVHINNIIVIIDFVFVFVLFRSK